MSEVTDVSVGIVGLGSIGGAVAQHILAAGHRVIAWARRPNAMDAFVARGGVDRGRRFTSGQPTVE